MKILSLSLSLCVWRAEGEGFELRFKNFDEYVDEGKKNKSEQLTFTVQCVLSDDTRERSSEASHQIFLFYCKFCNQESAVKEEYKLYEETLPSSGFWVEECARLCARL